MIIWHFWELQKRFNINNHFSNVKLGLNAVVVIDSISTPGLAVAVNDPLKYVRICGIFDNVYDTERKGSNNPIIHINKTADTSTDIPF